MDDSCNIRIESEGNGKKINPVTFVVLFAEFLDMLCENRVLMTSIHTRFSISSINGVAAWIGVIANLVNSTQYSFGILERPAVDEI